MGRSPCCEKAHTNKGAWTKEEDERLIAHIRKHGDGCWRSLPREAGLLRCGKSCRLRWINYLRPDLKRGNFTEDEDDHIIKLHSILGNKWSLIAGRLPGRTDNEIKNYWNTHIRRKLIKRGVDPQTHKLIQDHVRTGAKEGVSSLALEQQEKSSSESSSLSQAQPPLPPLFDEHRCPDLNLDLNLGLSISPSTPSFEQQRRRRPAIKEETESNGRCFYCKLGGLPQGKECRCNKSIAGMLLHYTSM